MPKVLIITNRLTLSGPTSISAYLYKYLKPEFETIMVGGVNDKHEENHELVCKRLNITPVIIKDMGRSINLLKDHKAYYQLKKLIADYKPDIVHTHASKAGFLGRIAAHKLKVPVIIHTFHGHIFHSYFNKIITKFFISIEKYLARLSTKIITISPLQKEEITNRFKICSQEKAELIPIGIELEKFYTNLEEKRQSFRKLNNIADDEIAIGIIGRLVPIKNHTLFINALKYAKDNTSKKIRAFIIGDGNEKITLKEYARDLGLFDKSNGNPILTFSSWIKEIDYAIAGMDIISQSSLNEGTPVSLIESQAANKPIIATNVGGMKDTVLEGKTAILCKNEKDYIEKFLSLIEDDTLRESLSKQGNDFVSKKFDYRIMIKNTKALYHNLLENIAKKSL